MRNSMFLTWAGILWKKFKNLLPSLRERTSVGNIPESSGTHPTEVKEAQEHPPAAHTDPKITEPNAPIVREDSGGTNGNSNTGIKNNEPKDNSPPEIGGRRTGERDEDDQPHLPSAQDNDKPPTSHSELVCRRSQDTWGWDILLSIGEDLSVRRIQRGLRTVDVNNGECKLESFCGQLVAEYEDRQHEIIRLFSDTHKIPFIFKLITNWAGDGRKVPRISRGYFIVIAPAEWSRTGTPPIEPERCADEKFKAHYFLKETNSFNEDIGGFNEYKLPIAGPDIKLKGTNAFDDSDEGELFIGTVPKLSVGQSIVWARVGSEGGEWTGENFKPLNKQLTDVLCDRQGRFYVRAYGNDGKLADSEQFRYLRDLKEIRVNGKRYSEKTLLIPNFDGHSATKVQFVPNSGVNNTFHGGLHTVEPLPDKDCQSWTLGNAPDNVKIVLHLPRIWWRLELDKEVHFEWIDTPLIMTRMQFREHAHADATLWLRLPSRISLVKVGFDQDLNRTYRSLINRNDIKFSLADFVDYSQIDRRLKQDVTLNIECENKMVTLIRILADPVPEITSFTTESDRITLGETAMLRWETQNAEPNSIVLEPDIGKVQTSGNTMIPLAETMEFTLRLKNAGLNDIAKTVTIKVVRRKGRLFTSSEIKKRLAKVSLYTMAEATGFTKQEIEQFLAGDYKIGRYQPKDCSIPFFYECMSDYLIERRKYERHAAIRRYIRRAKLWARKAWQRNTKQ